eukprot:gene7235-14764_t
MSSVVAFKPSRLITKSTGRVVLKASFLDSISLSVAELYSSPAATYNGELIDKSLKLVERVAKPAGYEYGSVSQDATPILAISLLMVIAIGALVPYILSIGEGALVQQREREVDNKIGINEFAIKARQQKAAGPVVKKGEKK